MRGRRATLRNHELRGGDEAGLLVAEPDPGGPLFRRHVGHRPPQQSLGLRRVPRRERLGRVGGAAAAVAWEVLAAAPVHGVEVERHARPRGPGKRQRLGPALWCEDGVAAPPRLGDRPAWHAIASRGLLGEHANPTSATQGDLAETEAKPAQGGD